MADNKRVQKIKKQLISLFGEDITDAQLREALDGMVKEGKLTTSEVRMITPYILDERDDTGKFTNKVDYDRMARDIDREMNMSGSHGKETKKRWKAFETEYKNNLIKTADSDDVPEIDRIMAKKTLAEMEEADVKKREEQQSTETVETRAEKRARKKEERIANRQARQERKAAEANAVTSNQRRQAKHETQAKKNATNGIIDTGAFNFMREPVGPTSIVEEPEQEQSTFQPEKKSMYDAEGNKIEMTAEDFMNQEGGEGTGVDGFMKGASSVGEGKNLKDPNAIANQIGIMSDSFSSLLNLGVTIASKDISEVNPWATAGRNAMNRISKMKSTAGKIKAIEEQDLLLAQNTQRGRNRGMARGINQLRALDLSTHVAGMGAQRGIDKSYYDRNARIDQMGVRTSLMADRMQMAGEERRLDKETANRDNYLSNLSQNITDIGASGQRGARTMNQERSNQMSWQALGNMGKYGNYMEDYITDYDPRSDYYYGKM